MTITDTIPSDYERACDLLDVLGAYGEPVIFTVLGPPLPKPRPRLGRGRAYPDPRQAAAEDQIEAAFRSTFSAPLPSNVAMACIFYRPDRRICDDDNLAKTVRDAAQPHAFRDDSQITAGAQLVELDRSLPRTVIAVAEVRSSLVRGKPLELVSNERRAA